jgi:hypothetical protein
MGSINKGPRHDGVSENGVIAPTILTSALDENDLLASRLFGFAPGEAAPGIHCAGC